MIYYHINYYIKNGFLLKIFLYIDIINNILYLLLLYKKKNIKIIRFLKKIYK